MSVRWRWTRSLRWRLLVATLAGAAVALVLAGLMLAGLFRDHVMRQFSNQLVAQLDQVTARLEFDAAGRPSIDARALSDPRWSRPYAGLYWQLDGHDVEARGMLRSRSLWDATLVVPGDWATDGLVRTHEVTGPAGATLMVVDRTLGAADAGTRWRLMVAADLREAGAAVDRFNGVLALSLALLMVLLVAAAIAQVGVGLSPLRAMQAGLAAIHAGKAQRLDGHFPDEVQPLIDDFNRVLDRNAEVVTRARTQAGNLAHAIKTPLAAMSQAAAAAARDPGQATELAGVVGEQAELARRHVDWHLARARAAAAHDLPGAQAAVEPVIDGLLRVMRRVHADRALRIEREVIAPGLAVACETQDLQEMLGNLLDNACKWAHSRVRVEALPGVVAGDAAGRGDEAATGDARRGRIRIVIDDDGPGIDEAARAAVTGRGTRLDESMPGSGLGLGIAKDLVDLYGGGLALEDAPGRGLRVVVMLPAGDAAATGP